MSETINIAELAKTLGKVIAMQKKLSDKAAQMEKEIIGPLKAQIIAFMDVNGMQSFNIPGAGTLAKRTTTSMDVTDSEALYRYMYWAMSNALKQGKKLADVSILQKSPHKGNIEELVKSWLPDKYTEEQYDAELKKLGISRMTSVKVGIYK